MSALFLLPPVVDWAWEIESCGNREVDMGIRRVDTRWWYLTKDLETLFRHVCPRAGGQSILKATALPLTVQDSGDWLVQTSIFPSLDTSSYLSFSWVTWHIPHMVQSPRTFLIPVYWKWSKIGGGKGMKTRVMDTNTYIYLITQVSVQYHEL